MIVNAERHSMAAYVRLTHLPLCRYSYFSAAEIRNVITHLAMSPRSMAETPCYSDNASPARLRHDSSGVGRARRKRLCGTETHDDHH